MRQLLAFGVIWIFFLSCTPEKQSPHTLKTGLWRGVLTIQGQELPFNFDLTNNKDGYNIHLINAGERLLLDEVAVEEDSVNVVLHIFDAAIKARINNDTLDGYFVLNYEKNYRLPFQAVHGQHYRFKSKASKQVPDFSGSYQVEFYRNADTTQAVGIFHQQGDSVTGTFLTATGDYRYLQGNVVDSMMQLSAFDGNHIYLFTAKYQDKNTLRGKFYSGKTVHDDWVAVRNNDPKMPDTESLTYLKKGHDHIEFTFPDADGNKISLADEKYKNKVVILQLLGTWCPNCMDETKFLAPWYEQNKDRGVEIIGLAYERKNDFTYASERVKKMIAKLNVPYDIVIAGTNDKDEASKTLPMLNKIAAFPTTIFIGKNGKVKKIHSGFSGPGTGEYYEQFIQDFNETVNELLNEDKSSYEPQASGHERNLQ